MAVFISSIYGVEQLSGECRMLADHHQTVAIEPPVTDGPLLRQAEADSPEQRRICNPAPAIKVPFIDGPLLRQAEADPPEQRRS